MALCIPMQTRIPVFLLLGPEITEAPTHLRGITSLRILTVSLRLSMISILVSWRRC